MRVSNLTIAPPQRLLSLAFPFFASGLAALVYQICWQRLLFVAFGADLQSITVIVSAFMLGLGVGALAGGRLADHLPEKIILLFAIAEVAIGVFGLLSPRLIAIVGDATMGYSMPVVALANFLLLLIPTSLMGATLPMLVAFLVKASKNVGVSIGGLYLINTLGAALGAFATGFVVFHYLDLIDTIHAAAILNFTASAVVLLTFRNAIFHRKTA